MGRAARAIVIEDGKILVMHRNKHGSEYFTLVGGRVNDGESIEQALMREVKEETGLDVTKHRLVYTENHNPPYNDQFIYLCEVAPHDDISIQTSAEEKFMNKISVNTHKPLWANTSSFAALPFRTIQLQEAIVKGLKKGFPSAPVKL